MVYKAAIHWTILLKSFYLNRIPLQCARLFYNYHRKFQTSKPNKIKHYIKIGVFQCIERNPLTWFTVSKCCDAKTFMISDFLCSRCLKDQFLNEIVLHIATIYTYLYDRILHPNWKIILFNPYLYFTTSIFCANILYRNHYDIRRLEFLKFSQLVCTQDKLLSFR